MQLKRGSGSAQSRAMAVFVRRMEVVAMALRLGDTAPDFTLLAFDGKGLKKISLQDYRGKKNVALAFFVFAFTGG